MQHVFLHFLCKILLQNPKHIKGKCKVVLIFFLKVELLMLIVDYHELTLQNLKLLDENSQMVLYLGC